MGFATNWQIAALTLACCALYATILIIIVIKVVSREQAIVNRKNRI